MKYERYVIAEQRKVAVNQAVVGKWLNRFEIGNLTGLTSTQVQHICDIFLEMGLMQRIKKYNTETKRSVFLYNSINEPYVAKTENEMEIYFNQRAKIASDVAHPKQDKFIQTNPYVRIIKNLDRPGSDYAWQRPKRKHTKVNIGSTFSLYDGV